MSKKITVLYEIDDGACERVPGVLLADELAATWAADYREFNVDYVKPTGRAGVYEFTRSGPVTEVQGVDQSIIDRLNTMSAAEFIKLISNRTRYRS